MKFAIGLCFTLALGCAPAAYAQDYPIKPVRIIVPFPAGTGADVSARQVAAKITALLGQSFLVENRPGASTIIGTEAAAKAAADGYTLYMGTSTTLGIMPFLYSKLPFNVERDFAPISQMNVAYGAMLVGADSPARDLKEFVALSKKRSLNAGTIGVGSNYHLFGIWFVMLTRADLNYIHYSTTLPAADLLSGRIEVIFDGLAAHAGSIKAGKVRVLAIAGKERRSVYPNIPTFAEAGVPEFEPLAWGGLFAPTGTPPAFLERLGGAVAKAVRSPDLVEQWRLVGTDAVGNTPAEFMAFVKSEQGKWSRVVKASGVRLD